MCVLFLFGGGTNIVGGVDPRDQTVTTKGQRCIVSLDMKRMNKVLALIRSHKQRLFKPVY